MIRRALLSCILVGVVACRDKGFVRVMPVFQQSGLTVPADVSALRVTVRGAGMSDITHQESLAARGVIAIPGIPAGRGRSILLEGLDAGEQVAYVGSGSVDIEPRATKSVAIEMQAAFAGAGIAIVDGDGAPTATTKTPTVTLSLTAAGAKSVTVANDQTFAFGRQTFALADLATAGGKATQQWNLNGGFSDAADGPRTVYAKFTSADGVVSRTYSAAVRLDSTAPLLSATALFERCDRFAAAQLAEDRLLVAKKSQMLCGPGFSQGPIRVSFALTEPRHLGSTRVFVRSGTSELPLTIDEAASTTAFVVAYYTPTDSEIVGTAGEDNVFAHVRDQAGNEADVAVGELRFDTVAPAAPNVDDPNCLFYERVPWGDEATTTSRLRVYTAQGCTSPVLASDVPLIVAYDAAFVAGSAPNAARVLGSAGRLASPAGSSDIVEVSGGDRPEMFVAARDDAGNTSAAVRVRNVVWTASMGQKVLGNAANPNRLWTSSRFIQALDLPAATEATLATPLTTRAGARWVQRPSRLTVPAGGGRAAWDSHRGRVLYMVGRSLWSWDGALWSEVCGGNTACVQPLGDTYVRIAYDLRKGELLALTPGPDAKLWAFTDRWRLVCGSGTSCAMPDVYTLYGVTYDSDRDVLVVVSSTDFPSVNRTYEWDGKSWAQKCTGSSCQVMSGYGGLVYHEARGKTVLYSAGITWEWNGSAWTKACDTTMGCIGPGTATGGDLVYNSFDDVAVLFVGGDPADNTKTSIWELSVNGWQKKCGPGTSCIGPSGRGTVGLFYDGTRASIGVSAGTDTLANDLGEMWLWRGDWVELCTKASCVPVPTEGGKIAYHEVKGVDVLHGGQTLGLGAATQNKTWTYDGGTWTNVGPTGPPSARWRHAVAYDAGQHRVFMFGGALDWGTQTSNQTWVWDGSWTQLCGTGTSCSQTPSARWMSGLVHDRARNRMVLFGGESDNMTTVLSDEVWEYAPPGATGPTGWSKKCGAGTACSGPPAGQAFWNMAYDERRHVTVYMAHDTDLWEWNGTSWAHFPRCTTTPACWPHATSEVGAGFYYDAAIGRTVVVFGPETWAWDGQSFTLLCGGASACTQSLGFLSGITFDGNVAATLDSDSRVGLFESGGFERSMHIFETNFGSAGAPDTSMCTRDPSACPIRSLQLVWQAGGRGYSQATVTDGVDLLRWRNGLWYGTAISATAPPSGAATSQGRIEAAIQAPDEIGRMLLTESQLIRFAVTPKQPNGWGTGELTTSYVAVKLLYRLP